MICDTCGHHADNCICPECPKCGEAGNTYCYEHGHLKASAEQVLGVQRMRVERAKENWEAERMYLQWLESHPDDIEHFEF